jgi:hypothetical protein
MKHIATKRSDLKPKRLALKETLIDVGRSVRTSLNISLKCHAILPEVLRILGAPMSLDLVETMKTMLS